MINVMERSRGAYISLCISVMYMEEIRGGRERERERERERDRKTTHFYSVTFTAVGDNLNEKIWDEGGKS